MSHAPTYSNLPGDIAMKEFVDLMKMTVREIARPTYYNRIKSSLPKKEKENDSG